MPLHGLYNALRDLCADYTLARYTRRLCRDLKPYSPRGRALLLGHTYHRAVLISHNRIYMRVMR